MLNVLTVLGRTAHLHKMSSWNSHADIDDHANDRVKLEAKKFQRLLELSLSGMCWQQTIWATDNLVKVLYKLYVFLARLVLCF